MKWLRKEGIYEYKNDHRLSRYVRQNIGNIKKAINPSINEIIKDIQLYVGIKDEAGNIKKEFQD
jgi:hypothetical protein